MKPKIQFAWLSGIYLFFLHGIYAQTNPAYQNYVGNYFAALNNLGDITYTMEERRAFREDLLNTYFLYEGSMLWNDLRPSGSKFVTPREYLDNILIDFPQGIVFEFQDLKSISMEPTNKGWKGVLGFRVVARPNGGRAISNQVNMVLDIQNMNLTTITGRIKSIDQAGSQPAPPVNPPPVNREPEDWATATRLNTIAAYRSYLNKYPEGRYAGDALLQIAKLEEWEAWKTARSLNTAAGYEAYIRRYPRGTYVEEARSFLSEVSGPKLSGVLSRLEGNMVYVEGGSFRMGCTGEQGGECDDDEGPVHEVSLSGYYIGKYEVTQVEWREVMGNSPSNNKNCDQCPVEQVSWDDIQEFIRKLNGLTGKRYRLPTESEWEYAARGGKSSRGYKYSGSNNLGEVGWYRDNSGSKTHPVGQKRSNELGLYDMSGNVWEWCSDWYGDYSGSSQTNPREPSSGRSRVFRGGSWFYSAQYCRVSDRNGSDPPFRGNLLGFRLARSSS